MKSLMTVLLYFLTLSTPALCEKKAEKEAIKTANHWLSLADAGNYATSWDEAAPVFKGAVSKEQWAKTLNATRTLLGRVVSRTIKSAVYSINLPG